MAQITYVNKEYLYENGDIPAKNKVQDTDMNEIKNVVNSNETKELLAVTNTAPAQCSTGDKYFNTSTKKIYTATATNTWGATGVAPTENTIYIEFTSQTAYAYDGTTLVSVGGGASGGGETLPVGTVLEFPTTDSTKVPDGWLFCDGSAVSRTTYADLFAIIGTSFGAGDGSTTFNLPTKEGLVSVGIKSSDTDFDTIGETGGSKELQNHNHTITKEAGLFWSPQSGGTWGLNSGSGVSRSNIETDYTGTGNSGNLQPYTVTNYIIKATQTTPIQAEVVNDYSTSQENAYSTEYVNNALVDTYSTNEIKTNKVWIDNKPIYRKVINSGSLSLSSNDTTINTNTPNIDKVIDINFIYCFTDNTWFKNWYLIQLACRQNGNVVIATSQSATFPETYITLEYTKTTD